MAPTQLKLFEYKRILDRFCICPLIHRWCQITIAINIGFQSDLTLCECSKYPTNFSHPTEHWLVLFPLCNSHSTFVKYNFEPNNSCFLNHVLFTTIKKRPNPRPNSCKKRGKWLENPANIDWCDNTKHCKSENPDYRSRQHWMACVQSTVFYNLRQTT